MMTQMKEGEAQALLSRASLARLGCVVDGDPYIVPVNYFFEDGCAYIHSLPGQKIAALRAYPRACLQVDEIEDVCHWRSVLAVGSFEEITNPYERAAALNELFKRFPMMTPIEAAIAQDATPPSVVVFRIRIEKICGVGER